MNIWIIVIYLSISFLFMIIWFYYLAQRRKRHKAEYPLILQRLKTALIKDDVNEIIESGNELIYNVHFTVEHRKYVFVELNKKLEYHPELKQIWKEAYYKYYGLVPD